MSLLENQTYKKKIAFVHADDESKAVTFVINVQCNHDIDKTILTEIEEVINAMLLKDYLNLEDVKRKALEEKAKEKQEKAKAKEQTMLDKELEKKQEELKKLQEKRSKELAKEQEDDKKQYEKEYTKKLIALEPVKKSAKKRFA
jgi:hypothetical protein